MVAWHCWQSGFWHTAADRPRDRLVASQQPQPVAKDRYPDVVGGG